MKRKSEKTAIKIRASRGFGISGHCVAATIPGLKSGATNMSPLRGFETGSLRSRVSGRPKKSNDWVKKRFDGGWQKREKWEAVNSKNLFPGIFVVLLIVGIVYLCVTNYQKSVAQAQLRQARQQIADLQSQLNDATNSGAETQSAEIARLQADNQDLPRLRKQIQQLQADNQTLSDQLAKTRQTAQQQEQQLDQIQVESEQAAEDQQALAQAAEEKAAAQRATCIGNLRLIYAAKQAWALEKNKTDNDTPTEQDLLPYIKGGVFPVCPAGGVYTIGPVGQPPTCSIPGHVLPQ